MKYSKSINIRFPEDIYSIIWHISQLEQRSINTQILYIIKKYYKEQYKDTNFKFD